MKNYSNAKNDDIVFKDLSFIALFSLLFGSMMGSGVFDIPMNIAHKASSLAVIISWCITAIGMLALGWALVYLIKTRPDIQSGIYGYAKYGFGNYVGFNAAWGYWLNALLGNAGYILYVFTTLGNFTLFKFLGEGNTLSALILESITIWLVYLIIICGIRRASIINIVITGVKFLVLAIVIVIFYYGFSWHKFQLNLTNDFHMGNIITQIKSTMLVTVWDFLGVEAACIYAIRAKNMNDVARATLFGVIAVLLIDALISILPFGILSSKSIAILKTPSTAGILSIIIGNMSANIVRIAVITSVMGALLAWMMLATNIFYLAASDNNLPKFLTRLNKRNVPQNSLLISSITLQFFIIVSYCTQSVYLTMIQLASSLILVPYLLSTLFAFKLVINTTKVDILSFIKGATAVIYGIWLIYAGGLKYMIFSTFLYIIGIVVYVAAKKQQKNKIFANTFERALCVSLIGIAVILGYLWALGYYSL
jgi:arginine:ornithine antiporter / lysine permease